MAAGGTTMMWCSGLGGGKMETWLSGGEVTKVEMTFL
jgi:hypothetical protein